MDDLFELMMTGAKRSFDTNRSYQRYCLQRFDKTMIEREGRESQRRRTSDSLLEYGSFKHRRGIESWVSHYYLSFNR